MGDDGLDTSAAVDRIRAANVLGGIDALKLVRRQEHIAVANHSIRTYAYAVVLADSYGFTPDTDFDSSSLMHACLLHDIGTTDLCNGPLRFEVEGATFAWNWLRQYGFSAADRAEVWDAIAVHTVAHIEESPFPVTRLTRLAIRTDFGADLAPSGVRESLELDFPRDDIERVLSSLVVNQAVQTPSKAPPGSWAAQLLAAHRSDPDNSDARLHGF
jgi:hypothetical protein